PDVSEPVAEFIESISERGLLLLPLDRHVMVEGGGELLREARINVETIAAKRVPKALLCAVALEHVLGTRAAERPRTLKQSVEEDSLIAIHETRLQVERRARGEGDEVERVPLEVTDLRRQERDPGCADELLLLGHIQPAHVLPRDVGVRADVDDVDPVLLLP